MTSAPTEDCGDTGLRVDDVVVRTMLAISGSRSESSYSRQAGRPGLGSRFVRSLSDFAFALTAGALFVVVPTGAGVREGLIVAALAGVMSAGEALGVAVVSRMVFAAGDCTQVAGVNAVVDGVPPRRPA